MARRRPANKRRTSNRKKSSASEVRVELPVTYHQDLGEAIYYLDEYLRTYGRIGSYTKEKWGRIDNSCYFGLRQLHSITHPGYMYSQYPKWLWKLDCTYSGYFLFPFESWVIKYQSWIYRKAYRNVLRKWPHLRDALLEGTSHHELLGAEFGIHCVRESENGYTIYRDWHPDRIPTELRYY